jgi:serine/threonine-protein kinase
MRSYRQARYTQAIMPDLLSVGSTIAGCRLDAVAGRGGMGVVYRATQLALGRPVALKAMAPQLAADDAYRERFTRESHLAASIDHPNVIPVYEAGESDGTLYLIMRWVEGTDLRALLNDTGRLDPARTVRLLRPVASALAAAHRRGLVHRDVKPANVLIAHSDDDEEHVYLTDFGIAKRTDTQSGMTRTGVLVGTIDYTSPERIEGGRGTPASDIYAFGCMLYEALTGHVPYERTTELLKMYAHMNDQVPSARAEVPGVPQRLDAVIERAMAKRPEDRFASAGELASALSRSLENGNAPTATADRQAGSELEPETQRQTVITGRGEPSTAPPVEPPSVTPGEPPRATPVEPPTPVTLEPPTVMSRGTEEPPAWVAERSGTVAPEPPPTQPPPTQPPVTPTPATLRPPSRPSRSRRSLFTTLAAIAVGAIAAVVIATNAGGGGGGGGSAIGAPGGITADSHGDVWVSYPSNGTLTRIDPAGQRRDFHPGGKPKLIAGGADGVWTSDGTTLTLRDPSGNAVKTVELAADPVALTASLDDGSVWAAEPDGTIAHATRAGQLEPSAAKITGTPRGLTVGAGWLWAVSADKLTRIGLGGNHDTRTFDPGGQQPVAVTSNSGIWIAHADGTVARFNPQPSQLQINAHRQIASSLTGIAAAENGASIWALSPTGLYKLPSTGDISSHLAKTFTSPTVGLAVPSNSVWVATQDGKLAQIPS